MFSLCYNLVNGETKVFECCDQDEEKLDALASARITIQQLKEAETQLSSREDDLRKLQTEYESLEGQLLAVKNEKTGTELREGRALSRIENLQMMAAKVTRIAEQRDVKLVQARQDIADLQKRFKESEHALNDAYCLIDLQVQLVFLGPV